jgi:hypothetical protein
VTRRIKVVPVEELKRQIDARNNQDMDSFYMEFYRGVRTTWSKYPCDIKDTCIDTHCFGEIYIRTRDDIGRSKTFQIEVMAIRKRRRTYILMDTQYHELMERGGFEECETEWVSY